METFQNSAAQGDILIRRIAGLPDGLTEVPPMDGVLVAGHSETGHHHVLVLDRETEERPNVRMYSGDNPLIAWLEVNRPTPMEHKRDFDTHAPVLLAVGIYEIRRQREHTPAGWRQVMD